MANALNYTEQGGAKTVIGGTLEIKEGASVTGITTATIVDNLTSTDASKALSAKQGKVLKTAVDGKYTAAKATTATAGLVKAAVKQNASTATDVAGVVADLNTLIAALKTSGAMASE